LLDEPVITGVVELSSFFMDQPWKVKPHGLLQSSKQYTLSKKRSQPLDFISKANSGRWGLT
jgi:hypothetical protein